MESLGFNPGWFRRRSRRTQGQRGRCGRTNESAGLRRTNDRRTRQGGDQPAILATFASGRPPDAMTVLVPGRMPAAGTALAGLAIAHPARRFACLQKDELFKNRGDQRKRQNPYSQRPQHAAEKVEDEKLRPLSANRDQTSSIPRRGCAAVSPRNRKLIRLRGGKKKEGAAASWRPQGIARCRQARKRKGGQESRMSELLACKPAERSRPRSCYQSQAGNNRRRMVGWQRLGRRAVWCGTFCDSTCRCRGSRNKSIRRPRRRQSAQGRRRTEGEPYMQPRRCAQFEGSERSPASLWSHYTMLKLKRESRRSTQTSAGDCILRRGRQFDHNIDDQ